MLTAAGAGVGPGALQRNLQVVAPAFHWRGPVVIYGGGVGELVVLSKTAVRLDSFDSTSI